jgi:hypothetical protein
MTPGAARLGRRHPHARRRRRGSQPIELGDGGGGLGLVASAKVGIVDVADVAGSVLELELPQRAQRRALVLGETLASVGRQREQRGPRAAATSEWPQRERHGGHADRQRGHRDADRRRHGSCSSSRRIRSRIA